MDRKHDGAAGALRAQAGPGNDKPVPRTSANADASRDPAPAATLPKDMLAALDLEFHEHFRDAPYYSSGRDWEDYAPAYRYGYVTRGPDRQCAFADREAHLAQGWDAAKGASRLCWAEARGAVQHAWQGIDSVRRVARRHLGPEH